MCFRGEWRVARMGAAFAQSFLDQFSRDGTDHFKILSLVEQSRLAASLQVTNGGGAGPSVVRLGG